MRSVLSDSSQATSGMLRTEPVRPVLVQVTAGCGTPVMLHGRSSDVPSSELVLFSGTATVGRTAV